MVTVRYSSTCYNSSSKIIIMKSFKSPIQEMFNKLFTSLLQRLIQQPDFYPIKHYHKRRKGRHVLDSL